MFSPIVRSAQRISTRNWAHNSSSLASLQIDAKCNANHNEPPTSSLLHNQSLSSPSCIASSVPVESKFEKSIMKSRLSLPNLLEDFCDGNAVQETSKVDIYHHFESQPNEVPQPKLTSNHKEALKKFLVAEQILKKDNMNNETAIKWLNAIKLPLLDTVRAKTSSFIDEEACRTLMSHMGDIDDPSTIIVIGNPGAGILSHQFLKKGAKQLVLFEYNANIRAHLEEIHQNHPVYVAPQYMFSSNWSCKNSQHALHTLLDSEYTRIKIVHALSSSAVSKNILTNYTKGLIPFEKKNVEMYLVADRAYGEKLVELETVDPQQKRIKFATAWRTFIKSEIVCTLPANAFFPTFAPTGYGINTRKNRDDKAVVLRCTFRPINCAGRRLSVEERNLYSNFIRHVMSNSTAKVIHSLEKWRPGIGIRLIREGVSLFTSFNQLTREEFERVFFIFLELVPANSSTWQVMKSSQNNGSLEWLKEFDTTTTRFSLDLC